MDLTSKKVIKNLLQKQGVRPSKKFGQNFLINKSVLRKILEAANLSPADIVLEIGPGIGNLTQELAKRVKEVITVEKDPKMVEILKETLKDFKNVKIIQADVLKLDPKLYLPTRAFGSGHWQAGTLKPYKIVANLPYYIVSPVIRKFLDYNLTTCSNDNYNPPKLMVLMVQKEVGQRICAKPPDMNLLAVSVQFYAKPEIISFVSKKSFWPQPKVDGSIIKILPQLLNNYAMALKFRRLFFKIVKAGFSQPRKQLINNLSRGLEIDREKIKNWLLKNKIQPTQRAETLSIENWLKLAKTYKR